MAAPDLLSVIFFFSSRRRHTRCSRDWSSDVCSSDLVLIARRAGTRRYYDLPERVLPPEVLAMAEPSSFETARWVALLKLRQRRLLWSGEGRGGEEGWSLWVPGSLKKKKIQNVMRHSD